MAHDVLDPATLARLQRLAQDTQRPGEDVLGELFALYTRDARARVAAIDDAVARGALQAAALAAHALKGASANLGAERVRARCAALEAAARQGDAAALRAGHARLVDELEEAIAALATAFRPRA